MDCFDFNSSSQDPSLLYESLRLDGFWVILILTKICHGWLIHEFVHQITFTLLSKISWPYLCRSISGFTVLFNWSICLSLLQYHTVLITIAIWWYLENWVDEFFSLFSFFKIYFSYFSSFAFLYIYFRLILSVSTKIFLRFDRNCIKPVCQVLASLYFVKFYHFQFPSNLVKIWCACTPNRNPTSKGIRRKRPG